MLRDSLTPILAILANAHVHGYAGDLERQR
jgi:hypothetical protein